jgi:ABC-type uncharacterized transport system YnjBCD permease subunit
MSDIKLNLDGLIAFLVAAALAILFALGLMIMSLRSLVRARRQGKRFSRQPAFPHLIGMFISLACCVSIMLFIWFTDGGATPHTLNVWLDRLSPLWGAIIVALTPVSSRLIKGQLGFADTVMPRV